MIIYLKKKLLCYITSFLLDNDLDIVCFNLNLNSAYKLHELGFVDILVKAFVEKQNSFLL